MASLSLYLDQQLERGRRFFVREEGLRETGLSPGSFAAAVTRLTRKRRLAIPRHGFYLILRPEDRIGPDPIQWIDPLMKYQRMDYRVSLLRAAASHGSSHQAAMVFQVIVPRQLRAFELGRYRLQYIYQAPTAFKHLNVREWLGEIKSDTGFAKVSGLELTLLDCARYFHKAGGISAVAQVVKDLGPRAQPRKLASAAQFYENSSVRRLGYLLELAGHERQAKALDRFAAEAKSVKDLDPAVRPLSEELRITHEKSSRWKLTLNTPVEFDA